MRSKIVPISNVARLAEAGEALLNRANGMPGMGLVYGASGYGKTTAVAWLATRQHGVFVRALATTTPSSLVESICKELGIARRPTNVGTIETIVEKLAETNRPLFVDEADYIADQKRLVETLRDIHDLASVPVILIGMQNLRRTISTREQLAGRIAQWVEFQESTLDDARTLARELAEVDVADDLLQRLHASARGTVRLIVVGLGRIEQFARSRSLSKVSAADWPKSADFFMGAGR
ncbi:ATP-binding protein [Stenotrophomonas maltophilia]|jgi:DNA transposition AAA+ family ATPase|uniref:AAA family ATPase n=1 Tax=Stenotrophomonas maltophilia TaxID=40324 RepID=UPI001310FDAF|nr:ATP-binding protein [Stenotrophomonas maltophilia]MBH1830498.1 ATP-binding protein [Stenotrophomonas maltophilia]MBH1886923.1 ATP-binding protein [Stenotrophomonas maltophilia]MBN5083722.1 ATP-binding protein [Stenotrophomonas maltophilia]MBN5100458.1 ATP-binding protein [Stenotrophomonas maltophilia]MBN5125772.1 ATP-binding protein [Stenotrophomonas maltophilia]